MVKTVESDKTTIDYSPRNKDTNRQFHMYPHNDAPNKTIRSLALHIKYDDSASLPEEVIIFGIIYHTVSPTVAKITRYEIGCSEFKINPQTSELIVNLSRWKPIESCKIQSMEFNVVSPLITNDMKISLAYGKNDPIKRLRLPNYKWLD